MKLEHSPVQEEDDDAHNDQTSPNQQTKPVEQQPPSIPGEDDELKVFGQDADGDQFITPLFEDKAELARENLVDGNQFDFELGDQQHFTPYTIGPFSAAPSQQQPCAAQFSPEQVPSEIMQETAQPQNNNNDPPQAEGAIVLPPYLPPVGMDGLRCPNPFPRMQLNGIAPGNVNYCLPPDSLFHDPANWSLLPPMDFLTGQPLLLAPRLISGEGVRLNGFNNHSLHPGGKLMAPPNLRFVLPRLQQQQQLYMLRPSNEARKWSPSRPGNPVVTNNQKDDSDKDDDDQEKRPHVKKPLNAFMIFMREERPKVIEDSELKESAAINQILGRKWHSLTKQQQSKYYDMAKEERENHMKLYPGWTARENYGLRRRRRKDPNRKLNVANLEQARKCRARYGSHRVDLWCRTCKRKKKCIRFPGNDDYEMMGILESPAIPGGSMIGRELLTGEDEEDFVEDDFNNECSMLKTRSPELLEIISSDDESEPEDEETITILHTKKQNPRVSSESNDSTEANDKDNDNKSHTSSAKENDSTSEKNVK